MTHKHKLFLNFDFYGSGNIGDDLSLDGLVRGISGSGIELNCSVRGNYDHQKFRFPDIRFYPRSQRYEIANQCSVWLGAGDTPVQIKSGDWFLTRMERDYEFAVKNDIKCYLLGIGAENEASTHSERFRAALEGVRLIWTRDAQSMAFLESLLEIPTEKLRLSSDLANISLSEIFGINDTNNRRIYDIGFCYYDESPDNSELSVLKSFLKDQMKNRKSILMFANAVNKEDMFEYRIYKTMFNPLQRRFSNGIEFLVPDYYGNQTLNELTEHYGKCETVVTSRYHALLAAAWAGCRLVSLQRSSKVTELAKLLEIEEVTRPFSTAKIMNAYSNAKTVDRNILQNFMELSLKSIREFVGEIVQ